MSRPSFFASAAWRALALALLASVGATHATSQQPAPAESIAIPAEALPQRVEAALTDGLDLESQGRWADAVAHYESALRTAPGDRRLERRFEVSRLHNSLQRRYADASFLDTIDQLDASSATELHAELLSKIDSHYVVTPPWTKLTRLGAEAMLIAVRQQAFLTEHGLKPSDAQFNALRQELINRLNTAGQVRNAREALRLAADFARVGETRMGVPATVWTFEFISAAAGGLDGYSAFLTPGQLRDVYSQIEGNFVGLGVELKADEGALRIVRVISGSPAAREGLKAGDLIVAVDGQQTSSMTTDEAAGLLTGPEGSHVYVTVAPSSRTIRVRREHVEVPSIEASRIADSNTGVAYMRIPVFQKSTSRDVETALWELNRQGMQTLVIDLRGNPGGLLTSAVELADKFVAQGGIVSTRGRSDGEDFDYRAHRAGTWRVPLVVLIDGDSASASEIFAAAIRDNRRGTIVGSQSFGKGSVQGIFPMTRNGAGVRLTTARFYSPSGRAINKVGVTPDVVVSEEATARTTGFRGAEAAGDDVALQRAIQVAREQAKIARQQAAIR